VTYLSGGALEVKIDPSGFSSLEEVRNHIRLLKKEEPSYPMIGKRSMISTTSMRPFIGTRARFLRN
jgi:hypothetical protein